jgi:hypothetical protein
MIADKCGLLIVACSRGSAANLLIVVSVNLKQVVARNHRHVLKTNGAF